MGLLSSTRGLEAVLALLAHLEGKVLCSDFSSLVRNKRNHLVGPRCCFLQDLLDLLQHQQLGP